MLFDIMSESRPFGVVAADLYPWLGPERPVRLTHSPLVARAAASLGKDQRVSVAAALLAAIERLDPGSARAVGCTPSN